MAAVEIVAINPFSLSATLFAQHAPKVYFQMIAREGARVHPLYSLNSQGLTRFIRYKNDQSINTIFVTILAISRLIISKPARDKFYSK